MKAIALTVGGAVAIIAGDSLLRQILPHTAEPFVSLLSVGGGIVLGWRALGQTTPLTQRRPRLETNTLGVVAANSHSLLDRAEAELAALADQRAADAHSDFTADVIPLRRSTTAPDILERVIGDLSAYPTFTNILKNQMNSVTELSDEAATSILNNLNGVDNRITALLKFIDQTGSSDKVSQIISQIEQQMDGCGQLLANFAERQAEDARSTFEQLAKISADTNGVLTAIQGVSGIARQTSMLSINVSIEAARAGEAGRGFTVIGTEIRNLAAKVQELSNEVHHRVEALMRAVTIDLEQQAKLREQTQRDAIADIAATLNSLTDNLFTVVTYNRDVMQKVGAESEAIGGPIMDIMAGLQFQDIIRQQLEQLNQMAGMVDDHIQSVGAALADAGETLGEETLLQKLDSQFGNYVMARQRQSHLTARGQMDSALEVVPRVELF